jgi:sporulation protein YlmC with PRC-barrel domain
MREGFVAALSLVLTLLSAPVLAARASELLGKPVQDLRGEPAGKVSEMIVDVRDGRVAYLMVERPGGAYALPARAYKEEGRVDTRLEGELALFNSPDDVRFRRAGKLLGQPLVHPHPGNTQQIGTIRDFEFDPGTGEITRVVVATDEGESNFPPGVLAHGRFPPLTQPNRDYLENEDLDDLGYVRRPPSDERRRLHDHQW